MLEEITLNDVGTLAACLLSLCALGSKVLKPMKDDSLWRSKMEVQIEKLKMSVEKQEMLNEQILRNEKAIMSHLLDGNHTELLKNCADHTDTILYKGGGEL